VFKRCRIASQKITTNPVRITEKAIASQVQFATYLRRSSSFFAPNICATGIANPLQTPVQNPITIKFREPVDPTPARGFTPSSFPTIIVSTML